MTETVSCPVNYSCYPPTDAGALLVIFGGFAVLIVLIVVAFVIADRLTR